MQELLQPWEGIDQRFTRTRKPPGNGTFRGPFAVMVADEWS
jgi:hypothetical protein